jgi:hypothetical protein
MDNKPQIKAMDDLQLIGCYLMSMSHWQVRRFTMNGPEFRAEPEDFITEMDNRKFTLTRFHQLRQEYAKKVAAL